MSLTWHIVKKDLRRLRWPLMGWMALMLLRVALGVRLKYGEITNYVLVAKLGEFDGALLVAQLIACYGLVAGIIHEDQLFGTDASWRVRPISGGRLLVAKLVSVVLVLWLLPVLVLLPWWLVNGYGLRELIQAAVETAGAQAAVTLPALLVAALTDCYSRFFTWSLVLVAVVVAPWLMVLAAGSMASSRLKVPIGLIETRAVLGIAVAVAGVALVVAHQYLSRRVVRSFALAGVAAGLVFVMSTRWPWDWSTALAHAAEPQPASKEITDAVSITFEKAVCSSFVGRDPNGQADLYFSVRGLAADLLVDDGVARCTWRWSDGTTVHAYDVFSGSELRMNPSLGKILELPTPKPDPETQAWLEAQRWFRRILPDSNNWQRLRIEVSIPPAAVARMRSDPPDCTIEISIDLSRTVPNETSLRPGLGGSLLSDWRLAKMERSEEERTRKGKRETTHFLDATFVEGSPALTSDLIGIRRKRSLEIQGHNAAYFLVDHMLGDRADGWDREKKSTRIGGVTIRWRHVTFVLPKVIRQGAWQEKYSPDWFDHATLARAELRQAGSFEREIKVDRFELQDPPEPRRFAP
jgi:hypothetical protein